MKRKIGISDNCGGDENVMTTLPALVKAGIEYVMPVNRNNEFERNIEFALELGLKIPYVHLAFNNADFLWAKGVMNEKYVNDTIRDIKMCAKHNIPVAVMHATKGDPSIRALEVNEKGLDSMRKILEVAKECNIKIAIENTDNSNGGHFQYLLDNIDSEWLGFCYDCGHHYLYMSETKLMEKYGNRCIAVHLHNNNLDFSYGHDWTRDLHLLPFDGQINMNLVAKDLAKSGYDGVLVIETYHNCFGEPKTYENITFEDFLTQVIAQAEKLGDMIQENKN